MLDEAEKHIEKVEIQDEVSDVPCDKCGAMMVYKMGRFGQVSWHAPIFRNAATPSRSWTYIDTFPAPSAARA